VKKLRLMVVACLYCRHAALGAAQKPQVNGYVPWD